MAQKSLLAGIDTGLLNKFTPDLLNQETVTKAPEVQAPKKKRRIKGGVHLSFSDQLKDDPAWMNETLAHIKDLTTHKITISLHKKLWEWGYSFVIHSFIYQRSEMDIMAIDGNGFVTEYEVKSCRQDYVRDFDKCVFTTKAMNKHGLLKKGEFITNRFYYVCPENLIDIDHLPDHAGLIYYIDPAPGKKLIFRTIKEAPMLHTNRPAPFFYKTVALRLYDRYAAMVKKYQHKSVLNFLSDGETNKDNSEHNSSAQGNVNAGG